MRSARSSVIVALLCVALSACGESAPNPYPDAARAEFNRSCPPTRPDCPCTWDQITRDMTYEEYEAAMTHFRETGSMDRRVTHARTVCLERGKS